MNGFVSSLISVASLMRTLIADARSAQRASIQSLMIYSTAIEQGVHSLLNETRELLVIALTDLNDDQSMARLRLRIQTCLTVHHVYEPLRLSVVEAEETLDRLEGDSEKFLGLGDFFGRRERALHAYRTEFLEVYGFLDALEVSSWIPSK